MTPPKPFALLDTVDMTTTQFDDREAMLKARAALIACNHESISFRWQAGVYWIDGMNLAQIEKIVEALRKLPGLPFTFYGPAK